MRCPAVAPLSAFPSCDAEENDGQPASRSYARETGWAVLEMAGSGNATQRELQVKLPTSV